MKRPLLILALVMGTFARTYACLNGEILELKDGTLVYEDFRGGIIPSGHRFESASYLAKSLNRLDSLWKATNDIDYLSDSGIILILLKEYQRAVDVYLKIESMVPNRYSTASNLGTVYELMGQNENALRWIKKAVEIDPHSHLGSEWLHVKILEAKIKGDEFITSDFLIGSNFGILAWPHSNLSNPELLRLRDALYYQLNERVSFIQPQDKIVASLLFDLANVAVLTGARHDALTIYEKAKEYGFADPLLELRYNSVKTGKRKTAKTATGGYLLWPVAGIASVITVSLLYYRSRRKKQA